MPVLRRKKTVVLTVSLALAFWMTISVTSDLSGSGKKPIDKAALPGEAAKQKRGTDYRIKAEESKILQEKAKFEKEKAIMTKRITVLKDSCENLKELNTFRNTYRRDYLSHLMVDDKNKFIYCFIPKIANTNFRRIFLGLKGVVPMEKAADVTGYEIYSKYDKEFVYLESYNTSEREDRLKSYKKILFVRKPLERLLSAYRNKFFHPNDKLRLEYYDKVLEFYQKYPVVADGVRSRKEFMEKPITFHEFLIYWADTFEVGGHINEHFMTFNDLCRPCDIHYDYVGKYDTLNDDVEFIFKDIGLDVRFPARNDNYSSVETTDLVLQYYLDMPADVMSRVWDVLRTDHILFDYQIPRWLKNKLS